MDDKNEQNISFSEDLNTENALLFNLLDNNGKDLALKFARILANLPNTDKTNKPKPQ